jgi:hypothetical protein
MCDTPITGRSFDGDLSVGLLPEIRTLGEARELCKQLELKLSAMNAERDALKKALRKVCDKPEILDGCPHGERVSAYRGCSKKITCTDCWEGYLMEDTK